MADLIITYVDANTNSPITKQLSGDFVGLSHKDGFLVAGSARKVSRKYSVEDENDPLFGETYEESEGIEEFHIPERAVYSVSVIHNAPEPIPEELK